MDATNTPRRFRVAVSFPGEKREFVRSVADVLSRSLGKDRVLYDEYLAADLARPNLDLYLAALYREQSDLVVPFFCAEYERKKWCQLEWRQMRAILFDLDGSRIMPFRFDDAPVSGLLSLDGYVKVDGRTPEEVASLILERLDGPAPVVQITEPASPRRMGDSSQTESRASGAFAQGERSTKTNSRRQLTYILCAILVIVMVALAATRHSTSSSSRNQIMINSPGSFQAAGDINIASASGRPTTGVLVPRNGEAITEDLECGAELQGNTLRFRFPIGRSVCPLGPNIPLWITKTREGLLINADIESMDGKFMADLADNVWRSNPQNYFTLNFDKSSLEIVDSYNIPWLQIDYLTPSSLKLGGVFRPRDRDTSNTRKFAKVASLPQVGGALAIGPSGVVIMGDGVTRALGSISVDTDEQKRSFVNMVREIINPWFDYTPSKGLGVRLPPESVPLTSNALPVNPDSQVRQ